MAGATTLWWGCEQLPLAGVLNYAVRALVLVGFVAVAWKLERGALRE